MPDEPAADSRAGDPAASRAGSPDLRDLSGWLSATSLRWTVGTFCALLGAMMLVVPHRFSSMTYTVLEPHFAAWGSAMLLSGFALLVVATSRLGRLWVLAAHLPAAVALLALGASFAATAHRAGASFFLVLGLGIGLAGLQPTRRTRRPRPAGDLFSLLMGVAGSLVGATLLVGPQLASPAFVPLAPRLPLLGGVLLAGGLPVAGVQLVRTTSEAVRRGLHLWAGGGFVAAAFALSAPLDAWSGVVLYGGCGLTLAAIPWLRRSLIGFDARSLRTRLALTLAMAASGSLVLTVALVAHQEERRAERQALWVLGREAEAVAGNIGDFVTRRGRQVEELAARARREAPGVVLEACRAGYPDFLGCALLGDDGSVARSEALQADPVLFDTVVAALNRARQSPPGRIEVRLASPGQRAVPVLSAPVTESSGALAVVLRPDAIDRRIGRFGAHITLRDDLGRLIARELPLTEGDGGGPGQAGPPAARLSVTAPVPGLAWHLVVEQSRDAVLAGVRQARDTAFVLLLLMAAVAVAIGIGAAMVISRPLDGLVRAVEQLEAGNPAVPLRRTDLTEIHHLSRAFERMRRRLAERSRDRERLAVELEARAEDLAEADRRKDEFLAMLAHELRNPLGAIANAVYMLQGLEPDDVRRDKMLATIERQTRNLSHLVEDLLDVSRITRGKVVLRRERIDLAAVVRQVVEDSAVLAEAKSHRLELDLPAGRLPVDADPTRLEQILANLLSNACKYTDPGGHIRVAARRDTGPDGAQRAIVEVCDSGEGIPPDLLPRVFDLFAQGDHGLDREDTGLGIGLTLVRRLVELHGGEIAAESAGVGEGSTFRVELPLAGHGQSQTAGEPAAPPEEDPERRVLVVDDHVDAAEALGEILAHAGHRVRVAHDGAEALAVAERFHPEVVLVDIDLPGMDGYELARRLREESGETLLISMTGFGQEGDRRRAEDAGFDHHLVKPISPTTLGELLAAPEPGA